MINFADIVHGTISFDQKTSYGSLVLELLDTAWVQRLRRIDQTGNTKLVYMFSEHSRFGHSLGVAYLAKLLLERLRRKSQSQVEPYMNAVCAAGILHDIGHIAPGSHLAEKIWAVGGHSKIKHESISKKVILEDVEIKGILNSYDRNLPTEVARILSESDDLPEWVWQVISGNGWNADRGNWSIVDSAMCCVQYGRYNVLALIDAFRISECGKLVISENRLDALTHFFVARDSMYRQVYQHRVLQAADCLMSSLVERLYDLYAEGGKDKLLSSCGYADNVMLDAITSTDLICDLTIEEIFRMDESWWFYHISNWCHASDPIVKDLATRVRDRNLFKTVRLDQELEADELVEAAKIKAKNLGFDSKYYVKVVSNKDNHRSDLNKVPLVMLDSGELVPVTEVEPLIKTIVSKSSTQKSWLAIPKEVKDSLGKQR